MGVLYSNLTGTFPFMSLEGNVCFLVVYHYKTNAILALPIKNYTDKCILAAYKQQFELLESKRHKIKLNIMDNQPSRVIKEYLTLQRCENLLVKPNNHQVNAAERAIQTFKAHFISALATTDSIFPLQLWDPLTPQVKHTLNMLQPSHLDPTKSAYKAIHGPYDWNSFLLDPPGCKAVIYKSPEAQGSWESRGTNAWCVGPSMDHYQCNYFFVPETRAYRISGSAELFPQHCQLPFLLWKKQLQEVIDRLIITIREMPPEKQTKVVTLIKQKLASHRLDNTTCTLTNPLHHWILPPSNLQRVPYIPPPEQKAEQRVSNTATDVAPPPPPPMRIIDAPPIMPLLIPLQIGC